MKGLRRLLIIMLFIPVLTACISSTLNLSEGIASFQAQDYRRAFIRLKPEAARGQPDAMYAVGYMYYYGQGVVEDRKKAWYWINKAAQLGQPDAITAANILEQGSYAKKELMQSQKLQRFPAAKMQF